MEVKMTILELCLANEPAIHVGGEKTTLTSVTASPKVPLA